MKTKHLISSNLFKFFIVLILISAHTVNAQVNCRLVERVGNSHPVNDTILKKINDSIAGLDYKISKRKTLHIYNATKVTFKGCKIIVDADVKLKRKIRKDAKGKVKVIGVVYRITRDKFCVKKAKVDKVRLSNTLRIGEGFYKWIANIVLPDNTCFDYEL